MHPDYKSRITGLCGNYNDNVNDEFQSVGTDNPQDFGNHFKGSTNCEDVAGKDIMDPCDVSSKSLVLIVIDKPYNLCNRQHKFL